jgi:hypothetical protein
MPVLRAGGVFPLPSPPAAGAAAPAGTAAHERLSRCRRRRPLALLRPADLAGRRRRAARRLPARARTAGGSRLPRGDAGRDAAQLLGGGDLPAGLPGAAPLRLGDAGRTAGRRAGLRLGRFRPRLAGPGRGDGSRPRLAPLPRGVELDRRGAAPGPACRRGAGRDRHAAAGCLRGGPRQARLCAVNARIGALQPPETTPPRFPTTPATALAAIPPSDKQARFCRCLRWWCDLALATRRHYGWAREANLQMHSRRLSSLL